MTDRPIPILAYHSFSGSTSKAWEYALEPSRFDEHCAYLRERNYFSLTLAESMRLTELAVSARPIVLTFNGAFEDFRRVVPILEKYQLSATLFVPTGFVGQESMWLEGEQRRRLLDWDDLRGLANIEIGSLGHEHLHLTAISESAVREDLARSKFMIEDTLGLPCQSFAYPYGETNAAVTSMVRAADFLVACTLEGATSTLKHDDFTLPRYAVTARTNLPDILSMKPKSRFSLLDIFRPQRYRQVFPAQQSRQVTPPSPTKVTTEQVRQERNQQVSLLRSGEGATPDPATGEAVQARRDNREPSSGKSTPATPGSAPVGSATVPLPPRSFRESDQEDAVQRVSDLDQQGDFLADLKTWIAQQQGKHLIEYNMLLGAAERLQASQEAGVFAPERVRAVYQAQAKLETALAYELHKVTEQQRVRLQACLDKLEQLPRLEALSPASDKAKHIVQDYLAHLSVAALSDDIVASTEGLVENLKERLNAGYRSGLQKLVQDATKAKAMNFLVTLQRTSNALDQGVYPDLKALAQSLDTIVHVERSQHLLRQRTQTFMKDLSGAARTFETVSSLNNEDVATVRQLLYYLMSQREVFPKVSEAMQQELETSLQEVQGLLEQLQKDHQATRTIASELVTGNIFDNLFGDDDSDTKR
jgi:peptidoglycan/xylan/chitin deacetylase (PgdA/CDA1 family)